jgi:hypothetical protein
VSGQKSVQIPEDSPLTLNITLNEDHKSGSISALVEWDHPPIPFKSPSILYDIHWFLNDCNNVYDSSQNVTKHQSIMQILLAFDRNYQSRFMSINIVNLPG